MENQSQGVEISLKIRSAIKAKLVELGAYVDEELPDYVMVMIANKKSKSQMIDDLQLFLGKHAEVFTNWLHDVLDKLQSMTAAAKEEKLASKTSSSTSSQKKKAAESVEDSIRRHLKTKGKSRRHRSSSSSSAGSSAAEQKQRNKSRGDKWKDAHDLLRRRDESPPRRRDERHRRDNSPPPSLRDEKRPSSHHQSSSAALFKKSLSSITHNSSGDKQNSTEKKEKVVSERKREAVGSKDQSVRSKTATEKKPSFVPSVVTPEEEEVLNIHADELEVEPEPEETIVKNEAPQKRKSFASDSENIRSHKRIEPPTNVVRPIKRSPPRDEPELSVRTTKRRSVVAKVVHREEVPEVEYDPLRPEIGNVASVVRITARKTNVPNSMMPRPAIFLRAVEEAAKATKGVSRKSAEENPKQAAAVRPLQLFTKRKLQELSFNRTEDRGDDERLHSSLKSEHQRKKIKEDADNDDETLSFASSKRRRVVKVETETAATKPTRIVRAVQSVTSQLEPVQESSEEEQGSSPEPTVGTGAGSTSIDVRRVVGTTTDSRKVESKTVSVPQYIIYEPSAIAVSSSAATNVDINNRASSPLKLKKTDAALEDVNELLFVDTSTSNTKFFVTLSGTGEELKFLRRESEMDWGAAEPGSSEQSPLPLMDEEITQTAAEQQPQELKIPQAPTLRIDLDDEDDDMDHTGSFAETPVKQSKFSTVLGQFTKDSDATAKGLAPQKPNSTERCHFWPNCRQGISCSYVHPTMPCRSFPNCRFGDRCLYVHPMCKFDAMCTNAACPYSHINKRFTAAAPPIAHSTPVIPVAYSVAPIDRSSVPCKFAANCRSYGCPYKHPKMCLYGVNCTRVGCAFAHPPAVAAVGGSSNLAAKFKWSATTSAAAAITSKEKDETAPPASKQQKKLPAASGSEVLVVNNNAATTTSKPQEVITVS